MVPSCIQIVLLSIMGNSNHSGSKNALSLNSAFCVNINCSFVASNNAPYPKFMQERTKILIYLHFFSRNFKNSVISIMKVDGREREIISEKNVMSMFLNKCDLDLSLHFQSSKAVFSVCTFFNLVRSCVNPSILL